MLQNLPTISEKCSIYRVPKRLLNIHGTAYTPQLISIGPLHWQDPFSYQYRKDTEQLKLRFLNSFLVRINMQVEAVITKVQKLGNEARNYYADFIELDEDDFVKMMLVDGCFAVELMMTVDDPQNGVMEIPSFEIHDVFEPYLRNLMAFEHFSIGHEQRYVIHYVSFLDGLISTGKDVSLLVKAKIITNNIGGNDEEIAKLFNDLCKDVAVASDCYYFDGISKELREHCRKRRHRWMASLRRDYFNTPWASISFSAATFLILLTLIQTIASVLGLHK